MWGWMPRATLYCRGFDVTVTATVRSWGCISSRQNSAKERRTSGLFCLLPLYPQDLTLGREGWGRSSCRRLSGSSPVPEVLKTPSKLHLIKNSLESMQKLCNFQLFLGVYG